MRKFFIIIFAFFVRLTNGQSSNPFAPYFDELTVLLPQIQSSTVNVSCTFPLIQDTQIALSFCSQFMKSSLSATSTNTFLASISGLTTQIKGLYAACIAGGANATTTTTTTTTTLPPDPRMALLPQLEFIISNLTTLFNVSTASSASSCCLEPIKYDIQFLVSWTQTLKSGILSQSYGLETTYIQSLYNNIQQLYSNFTDCQTVGNCCNITSVLATTTTVATTTVTSTTATTPTTTTPTTVDPRLALASPAQQLLAELLALLQTVQSYTGSQAGVPPFVINLNSLISQIQALIASLMNIEFTICSTTLNNLLTLKIQEAAAWAAYVASDVTTTLAPTTAAPTTLAPTTEAPTTLAPTTEAPTTLAPTTAAPTTLAPTTEAPTTLAPTTAAPTTLAPTTEAPTTLAPTTAAPTTLAPTTEAPTTLAPTTLAPTTLAPTTEAPTTLAPTTLAPTTEAPTTLAPTTLAPTTLAPTTLPPTTLAPTTLAPTTLAPTTLAPTTLAPTTLAPTTLAPTTTAPTTTVATTTTLPPLNTAVCSKTYSFLGMAVTACLINGAYTYQQATAKCNMHGMIQLAMVNGLQWTAFNAFALIALVGDTNFWLNGLHDGTAWYAYYPAPVAIYPGIVSMIQGTPSPGNNCLKVYKPGPLKPWTFTANSCAATMSILCQY